MLCGTGTAAHQVTTISGRRGYMKKMILVSMLIANAATAGENANVSIETGLTQSRTQTSLSGVANFSFAPETHNGTFVRVRAGEDPQSQLLAELGFGKSSTSDGHFVNNDKLSLDYIAKKDGSSLAPVVGAGFDHSRDTFQSTAGQRVEAGVAYVTPKERTMILVGYSSIKNNNNALGYANYSWNENRPSIRVLTQQNLSDIASIEAAVSYTGGHANRPILGGGGTVDISRGDLKASLSAKARVGKHGFVRAEWIYDSKNTKSSSSNGYQQTFHTRGNTVALSAGAAF